METNSENHIAEECRASVIELLVQKKANLFSAADEINQQLPAKWAPSKEHAEHLGKVASVTGKLELVQELICTLQTGRNPTN